MQSFANLARADYLHHLRVRRWKNALGCLLTAASIVLVYLLGLGG